VDVIHGIESVKREPNAQVTVGSFDGLHLGHQRIFRLMRQAQSGPVTVVTFRPHPQSVLRPDKQAPPLLTTFDERVELYAKLGINRLVVIPFDAEFGKMSAEQFVEDILFNKIGMERIFTGPKHRFGIGGKGDNQLLSELGEKCGFESVVVPQVTRWGSKISSHRTRQVLLEGDPLSAWRFLGRPYYIIGMVGKGDGRGKKIGFPTANLNGIDLAKLRPPSGIYATLTEVNGIRFPSVSHFGDRPTFPGAKASVESHIIHFTKDVYGADIRIGLVDKLRDVKAFTSVPELVHQMHDDRSNAMQRLAELGFAKDARLRQQRYGVIKN